MKHLSISLSAILLTLALAFSGAAFTSRHSSGKTLQNAAFTSLHASVSTPPRAATTPISWSLKTRPGTASTPISWSLKTTHSATCTSLLKSSKQYIYYWYTVPDDSYNDYQTLDNEEYEWMWIYGWAVLVDTNPMGGTLIARGYMTNEYPHRMFPAAYLYAHYTY